MGSKPLSTTEGMDSKLFRLPTKPNFYAAISNASPFDVNERQKRTQAPAPDSRYPGWAAQMADGRLVTNYQNHCSRNIPAGSQFATKEWMTKNAAELINLSRRRYAEQTGAYLGLDRSVVPPPALVVECSSEGCERTETEQPGGIGMERAGATAPPLFGTWDAAVGGGGIRGMATSIFPSHTSLTRMYEGGRNTPRGGAAEMA